MAGVSETTRLLLPITHTRDATRYACRSEALGPRGRFRPSARAEALPYDE